MRLKYFVFIMSVVGSLSLLTVGCGPSPSANTSTPKNIGAKKHVAKVAYYVKGLVGGAYMKRDKIKEIQMTLQKAAPATPHSSTIPFHTVSNVYNLPLKVNLRFVPSTNNKTKIINPLDKMAAKVWKNGSTWTTNNKNFFLFRNGAYYNVYGTKLDVTKVHWQSVFRMPHS